MDMFGQGRLDKYAELGLEKEAALPLIPMAAKGLGMLAKGFLGRGAAGAAGKGGLRSMFSGAWNSKPMMGARGFAAKHPIMTQTAAFSAPGMIPSGSPPPQMQQNFGPY